jgi:hypothetical protein
MKTAGKNDHHHRFFESKTDSGEVCQFELDGPEYRDGKWAYKVRSPGCSDFFEFRVVPFDEEHVRIDMMTHNDRPEFMKKGIPEYLIPTVAKELNKKILSSIKDGRPIKDEYRTLNAEKFWKRMVEKKKAIYHDESDRYEFTSEEILG